MKKYRERLKNGPEKKKKHLSKDSGRQEKQNIKEKENSSARLWNKRRA